MITYEEFKNFQEAYEKANEDDTPRLAVVDDEMHVLGDPNKTEKKMNDYTVRFAFPNEEKYKKENIIKETPNYLICEREYKDVFIPAKRHPGVVGAFTRLEQFIMDIREDGEVEPFSDSQIKQILELLDDEIIDAVSDVIGKVLGLTPFESDCIVASSALKVIAQMMTNIPEVVSEADYFFG